MGVYTQIPVDVAETLQMNAGVIAKTFNPATGEISGIVGATTGGISISAVPAYTDFGEDVDNCPKNTKELKQIDSWECKISGTYLTITASRLKELIGAASLDQSDPTHVVLKNTLTDADFQNLWFVGDYGVGGFMAVKLSGALNTAGFSVQTTDKSKGQISFEYTGHPSVNAPTAVPIDVYVKDGVSYTVTYNVTYCARVLGNLEVVGGADLVARFKADNGKTLPSTITVTEGGSTIADGTDYEWDSSTGVLVISAVEGNIVVTVVAT